MVKPADKLTRPEMMDLVNSAQGDYTGWRSGNPLQAHTYEKVQDWHLANYGDQPQGNDGGKPIEPQPNWIGPKTIEAFGTLLKTENADKVTQAFGQGLGFL